MQEFPLIYAHRGVWENLEHQNSFTALELARNQGFGVETDFRSENLELAISHNPISSAEPLKIKDINLQGIAVALNVKEDGLAHQFTEFLQINSHAYSFIFDGSIPEMVKIRDSGLPHALRLSEYETEIPWKTEFLWVDGFNSEWWIDSHLVSKLLSSHFLVFVSPELHGRPYQNAWNHFENLTKNGFKNFGVCTDFPKKLKALLHE
jgi:hypothetical protein